MPRRIGEHAEQEEKSRQSTLLRMNFGLFALGLLTIMLGQWWGINTYVISTLLVVYSLIPFFVNFEKERTDARTIVLLAIFCALAVVSRVMFALVPSFKPLVGIVIITGIALGSTSGFACGAFSALVSNFIFGQGPWTPWQMLAYGSAGLVAGQLADRGIVPRSHFSKRQLVTLSLVAGLFTVIVVGGLLDTCTVFTILPFTQIEGVLAVYVAGIPFNLVHGGAVTIVLLLATNPMLGAVARVRSKYGL